MLNPLLSEQPTKNHLHVNFLALPQQYALEHTNIYHYNNPNLSSKVLSQDYYSLHCDASMYGVNYFETPIAPHLPNSIIAGIIKHNDTDFFLFKKPIICRDNNLAELNAIYEGLQIAAFLEINQLRIYTDSSVSITFIRKHIEKNEKYMKKDQFLPLTQSIISLLPQFESCSFYHVPRKMNRQADKITKQTRALKV